MRLHLSSERRATQPTISPLRSLSMMKLAIASLLPMSETNLSPYIEHWKYRLALQREQNQDLAHQARQRLPEMIQLLTTQFHATQIILFGSLAKGTFRQGSDIDLAVAGIPPENYFSALAAINRLSDSFSIDLKPIEDLEPHFFQRVIQTGEYLYGADVSGSNPGNSL
jgi:uncharacterized protein